MNLLYDEPYNGSEKEKSDEESMERIIIGVSENIVDMDRSNPPGWPVFADKKLNYDYIQNIESTKEIFYIFYINATGAIRFVCIRF